ncbi:MAG: DUF624 domain-containing protein [Lachnospiraceae bacterium]|nr:DUF624 domain-containing protein [Lachnospiraceae bacterium]
MKRENRLLKLLKEDLFLLVKMNLLFLAVSWPVVTIPAALTAMMKISTERARDREVFLFRDFMAYFRASFLTSLRTGLLFGALFLLASYVHWAYGTAQSSSGLLIGILRGISLVQMAVVYVMSCYVWVIEAVADLPFFEVVKRSFQLMLVYVRESFLCLLIGFGFFALELLLFPYSLSFFFLFGVSLWSHLVAWIAFPPVEKHIPLN